MPLAVWAQPWRVWLGYIIKINNAIALLLWELLEGNAPASFQHVLPSCWLCDGFLCWQRRGGGRDRRVFAWRQPEQPELPPSTRSWSGERKKQAGAVGRVAGGRRKPGRELLYTRGCGDEPSPAWSHAGLGAALRDRPLAAAAAAAVLWVRGHRDGHRRGGGHECVPLHEPRGGWDWDGGGISSCSPPPSFSFSVLVLSPSPPVPYSQARRLVAPSRSPPCWCRAGTCCGAPAESRWVGCGAAGLGWAPRSALRAARWRDEAAVPASPAVRAVCSKLSSAMRLRSRLQSGSRCIPPEGRGTQGEAAVCSWWAAPLHVHPYCPALRDLISLTYFKAFFHCTEVDHSCEDASLKNK